MYDRWVVRKDYTMPDIPEAEDPERTLTVATTGMAEPFAFYAGNELAGFDIELAKRFAAWLGANLQFKVYDWGGLLAAAQAGDADCIMSNLYYRPKYEETTDFSDPLFTAEITAMVRDRGASARGESFWPSIKSSFRRTFLEENAIVTISYNGTDFDPAEGENRLAYDVLKKTVHSISYSYNEKAELPNTITVLIK